MWLAVKYAADIAANDRQFAYDQLGEKGAHHYFRLYDELSRDMPQGPEESLLDYYARLKSAKNTRIKENVGAGKPNARNPSSPFSLDKDLSDVPKPDWLRLREQEQAPPPAPTRQSDLPARDPGWWTSPWSESRGYGVPPMTQRNPGHTMNPGGGPGYAPDPQSMQDWVQWLRSKGISVNHSLQVPNAARPEDMPRPPVGRRLMQEFVEPTTDESMNTAVRGLPEDMGGLGTSWRQRAKNFLGRRKASATVVDYIEGVLVATASLEDDMAKQNWHYHKSGSGNWYQNDNLGGKVHVIEQQPDGSGWIHNSGPSEDEMGDDPRMFASLEQAMLHAHGISSSNYHPRPPTSINKMNSASTERVWEALGGHTGVLERDGWKSINPSTWTSPDGNYSLKRRPNGWRLKNDLMRNPHYYSSIHPTFSEAYGKYKQISGAES